MLAESICGLELTLSKRTVNFLLARRSCPGMQARWLRRCGKGSSLPWLSLLSMPSSLVSTSHLMQLPECLVRGLHCAL